jgi:hypothetical protein
VPAGVPDMLSNFYLVKKITLIGIATSQNGYLGQWDQIIRKNLPNFLEKSCLNSGSAK